LPPLFKTPPHTTAFWALKLVIALMYNGGTERVWNE